MEQNSGIPWISLLFSQYLACVGHHIKVVLKMRIVYNQQIEFLFKSTTVSVIK